MAPEPPTDGKSDAWRFAGIGGELVAAIIGFSAIGWLIDWRYGTGPYGLLICALLGLIGGMYNFIRQSLKAVKQAPPPRKKDELP
ncbi:MAG TPA: AtpZ/AtpI family protein [Phycisphaerae bacterium]